MTPEAINELIVELVSDFDDEVIGTTFIPKEQAKKIMMRKLILLAEALNKNRK